MYDFRLDFPPRLSPTYLPSRISHSASLAPVNAPKTE